MSRSRKALEMVEGEYQQWFKGEKTLPGTVGAKDPYPKIVRAGLDRSQGGGDKDLNWVWFRMATEQDRDEFEKYLVDTKDPLAYQAGSPEWRYKEFMRLLLQRLETTIGGKY